MALFCSGRQRKFWPFGQITEQGDRYIRQLLVVGMTSRAVMAKRLPEKVDLWTAKFIADKMHDVEVMMRK